VYAGNLPFDVKEEDLRELFSSAGVLTSISIPKKQINLAEEGDTTTEGRGFAFIGFGSIDQAANACMLTGTEFRGRKISVDIANNEAGRRANDPAPRRSQQKEQTIRQLNQHAGHSDNQPKVEQWGRPQPSEGAEKDDPAEASKPVELPNFEVSGNLAKAENTTASGIELKFSEPDDARKPTTRWRLYVFKNGEPILEEDGG